MYVMSRPRLTRVVFCLALAAAGGGCANLQLSAFSAASSAAPVAGAASSPFAATSDRKPDPSPFKAFDEVVKGAQRQDGFIPVWRRQERVWLEIAPALLDQPLLLSVNIAGSVGERGLYGSQMGPSWLAIFRRIGDSQIQLVALNTSHAADGGAMQAAIEQGFSHSLIGSSAVVSAPHPASRAVLIDAAFLLSDIPGYSTSLESAFRLPFGVDRGNSFFEKINTSDTLTTLNARVHFATARIPALRPSADSPPPPRTTPDPRSLFVSYVYNFLKPPAEPMARRRTDPRLGHFFDVVTDLSSDLKPNPRIFLVQRWRLEKKDPQAEMSEPVRPIVYWLDKNIPPRYRKSVEAGVLEWNKAFERIGFRNALLVRQQADDADWDTMDARHASIRWFVGADSGFAIGPRRTDPRTGEIFDADIGISDVFGRGARRFIVEDVGRLHVHSQHGFAEPVIRLPGSRGAVEACTLVHEAAAEMNFALDLLEARGELDADDPQAETFVQEVIKETVMHEVGHTLGLKHNFKASTVVKRDLLRDRDFTEKNGISGSVMDYNSYNLPVGGEPIAAFNNSTIGPYDYWAIEYAYKPIDPADEERELLKIAARAVTDPMLAYADDVDSGGLGGNDGIDPLASPFDLGDDPLDFHRKRLQLARELWQRVQQRQPQPGDDLMRQRRVMFSGFRQLGRAAELVGKYVGGMHAVRDLPGTSDRRAFTPVDPAKQREALRLLTDGLFKADSFSFRPEFLANLAPDYNEWERSGPVSVPAAVLSIQGLVLNRMFSAGTANRLLDLPMYLPKVERRNLISLAEVYSTLQASIWSELRSGEDITQLRRNLQREHLKRVQGVLTRGSSSLPPDALSLMRMGAVELQRDLQRAAARSSVSIEAKAHLRDSLALLSEALKASMTRS